VRRFFYYVHIAFNNDKFATTPPSGSGVIFVSTYRFSGTAATYARTDKIPGGSGLNKAPFEVGPGNSNFDDKEWITVDNTPTSPFYVFPRGTRIGGPLPTATSAVAPALPARAGGPGSCSPCPSRSPCSPWFGSTAPPSSHAAR
jgi:hypothetical protein